MISHIVETYLLRYYCIKRYYPINDTVLKEMYYIYIIKKN